MLWTASNRIPSNGLNKNTSSYPPEQGIRKSGSQGWVIKLTMTSRTLALSILPLLHLWHVGLQSLGLVSHGCVMAVVVPDTTCLHHQTTSKIEGSWDFFGYSTLFHQGRKFYPELPNTLLLKSNLAGMNGMTTCSHKGYWASGYIAF